MDENSTQLAFGRTQNAASLIRGVAGLDPVFGGLGPAASLVADAVSSGAPIDAIQSAVSGLGRAVASPHRTTPARCPGQPASWPAHRLRVPRAPGWADGRNHRPFVIHSLLPNGLWFLAHG